MFGFDYRLNQTFFWKSPDHMIQLSIMFPFVFFFQLFCSSFIDLLGEERKMKEKKLVNYLTLFDYRCFFWILVNIVSPSNGSIFQEKKSKIFFLILINLIWIEMITGRKIHWNSTMRIMNIQNEMIMMIIS